jgi:hypothetical protein
MQTRTWAGLLLLAMMLAGTAIGCKSDGSSSADKLALERAAAKRAYDADPDAYHEPIGAD